MGTLLIGHEFYGHEMIANKEPEQLFDPTDIEVKIVDNAGNIIQRPSIIRLGKGSYIAYINSNVLIAEQTYQIRWIWDICPGSQQISRETFTYLPEYTTINGMCRVFGNIKIVGLPASNKQISFYIFRDGYSKHFAESSSVSDTNCFGSFSVYLPINRRAEISFPDLNTSKFFLVPNSISINYNDLIPLTSELQTDSFGNPV
jgi:hypothetical protein